MGYRQTKTWKSKAEKLEALKALRGQHDQTIRCGVIEVLYGQKGETNRFLEDAITKMEEEAYSEKVLTEYDEFEKGHRLRLSQQKLWPAGEGDGD